MCCLNRCAIDRTSAEESVYYSKYFEDDKKPLKNWLTIEILGLVLGGFISGCSLKSLNSKLKIFQIFRIPGGMVRWLSLEGIIHVCAQLARGCTSGAALSGMAVLSVAGYVTMIAIFGSAYLFAWFFRKNWI